jgi:transposase-like protein
MAQHRDANKQTRWLNLIGLWQRSQFSIREFCKRRGLSETSFHSWRRVLRRRGLLQDLPTLQEPVKSSPATAFVKLTVDAEPPAASAIDLVLSERRFLRIRPGFDAATLRELVRLLEEPSC